MSEKVKLTQEQADVVEKLKSEHLEMLKEIFENPQNYETENLEPLLSLTAQKYHDALYNGYEVEPEFNVGDWVVVEDCPCERIIGKVQKITDVEEHRTFTRLHYDMDWWSVISRSTIRHATPEEIEQEKERRWWSKHNRDVWELKQEDVVIGRFNRIREVDEDDGDTVSFFGGFTSSKEYVKETCKVVCFADDRKDV